MLAQTEKCGAIMGNDTFNIAYQLLATYVQMLPMLIVYAVGAGLAVVWWKRHPRVSACALAGFGGGLLINVAYVPIYQFMQMTMVRSHGYEMMHWITLASLLRACLTAACYVCLIVAVFSSRQSLQPTSNPDADSLVTYKETD